MPLVRPAEEPRVAAAERIALAAWHVIGGRDGGRIDMRCDDAGLPQIMEINPLAGLHPTHSDLPILWTAIGRQYIDLIDQIVASAGLRRKDSPLDAASPMACGR